MNEEICIFNDIDVFYLANNFSVRELKGIISKTQLRFCVAEYLSGTPYENKYDQFPFRDFIAICQEAIRWQLESRPKQLPRPGYIDVTGIKARIDIVEVAERYTTLRKSGRYFSGLCPIHTENSPSFYVYPDQQNWHCFGACGSGGDVISLVMAVEKCDFRQAVGVLNGSQ